MDIYWASTYPPGAVHTLSDLISMRVYLYSLRINMEQSVNVS